MSEDGRQGTCTTIYILPKRPAETRPTGQPRDGLYRVETTVGLLQQFVWPHPSDKQVQALNLGFSRETLVVVQNLCLTDEARNDVSQIIQALQRYVDGNINETVER